MTAYESSVLLLNPCWHASSRYAHVVVKEISRRLAGFVVFCFSGRMMNRIAHGMAVNNMMQICLDIILR